MCTDPQILMIQVLFQVKVVHCNAPRIYRIAGVTELGASKQTFSYKDEETGLTKKVTVQDCLEHMYGKRLLYPNFNCVQVAPAERNIFFPMEV